jgi:chromosome segregation ATPase
LVAWREAEVTQAEIAAYQAATGHLAHALTELAQGAAWRAELAQAESRCDELEQAYGDAQRPERPHSQLARARQHVAQLEKRIQRGLKAVETHEQRSRKLDATLARLETERQTLVARRAELEADNQSNSNPVSIRVRMDAGFGSGAEIAWLIEMGYTVYTKAYSDKVAQAMRPLTPCGLASARTPR